MKSANIFSPSFFITELTTMPRCYMALTIFFILTIIMGIPTSLMWGDMFSYPIWADRALVRSYNLFTDFQFGGSELMTGGQTPGSFYYLLLRCILTFTDNPLIIHRVMLVAYALSVVGCYFLARRVCNSFTRPMRRCYYGRFTTHVIQYICNHKPRVYGFI